MIKSEVSLKKINGFHEHMYMLMLNELHESVSGNKFFKLFLSIQSAINQKCAVLVSMGGAFSNHLVALAYVGNYYNLKTKAFIRGEENVSNSLPISLMKKYGMELVFLSRSEYKNMREQGYKANAQEFYIPEGGSNELGIKGASYITQYLIDSSNSLAIKAKYTFDKNIFSKEKLPYNFYDYDFIVTACGTATTFKGLLLAAGINQTIVGIQVLKANNYLNSEVQAFCDSHKVKCNWKIFDEYHAGGYAKKTDELDEIIKSFKSDNNISLEFVYTGKMVYAITDLVKKSYFPANSKILLLHTGGVY